jgi:hypothetical protein
MAALRALAALDRAAHAVAPDRARGQLGAVGLERAGQAGVRDGRVAHERDHAGVQRGVAPREGGQVLADRAGDARGPVGRQGVEGVVEGAQG